MAAMGQTRKSTWPTPTSALTLKADARSDPDFFDPLKTALQPGALRGGYGGGCCAHAL